MNKITFFGILIYLLSSPFTSNANNILVTSIDLSNYPEVRIRLNIPKQEIRTPFSIEVYENDSLINIKSLRKEKINHNINKSMLILIEDMSDKTHPGQRKFIKEVLEKTIPRIVNKNDKVNIVIFNRSQKGTTIIHLLLKNYTDDTILLRNAIKRYKSKNNIFYQQLSSDLYYAIFDGLNELEKKFPNGNKVLLLFSAGKNNMKSQEVTPDRSIEFSREYRIPIFSIQYYMQGWEHNRITALIYGTNGKEVVTNNVEVASDSLQSFLKNISDVTQGQDYSITYNSPFQKDGKIRKVKLLVNNIPILTQYVSPTMKVKDYITLILRTPKYWISATISLLALIFFISFFLIQRKKKKEEAKRVIKNLASKEEQSRHILNEYQNKLSEIEKSLQQKQKSTSFVEKIKEKNLHGIFPRLIYKVGQESITYPISKPEVSIGRSSSNDITLKDSLVSRSHCAIVFDGESFSIIDKDSTNGTFVNNLRIKNQILKHGDQIKIGSIEIAYIE